MCRRQSSLRNRRALWLAFLLTLFAIGFAIGFRTGQLLGERPEPATPTRPAPAPRSEAFPPPVPEPSTGPHDVAQRTEFGRELQAIANAVNRIGELWDAARPTAAAELDRECDARLAALVASRADAGECALAELANQRDGRHAALVKVTRRVLTIDCERRDDPDHLVATALATAGRSVAVALAIDGLADGDWLGAAHAPAIEMLTTREHVPAVTRLALLRSHWRIRLRGGPRVAAHLTSTAHTWLTTGNPCQRQIAYEHLLRDPRRRESVLGHLRRTEPDAFVQQLAVAIGAGWPGDEAAEVLLQLSRAGTSVVAGWLALGERDPVPLRETYCSCLADAVAPTTRRDILSGLGLASAGLPIGEETVAAAALETLEFAATNEPLLELRLHALVALSAVAPARFESAAEVFCRERDSRAPWRGPTARAFGFAIRNLVASGATVIARRCAQRLAECGLGGAAADEVRRALREGLPWPQPVEFRSGLATN